MCEHSTASQANALRREARRRKILENSTNRLKLIEGINSSLDKTSDTYLEAVGSTPCIPTEEEKEVLSDGPERGITSALGDLIKENKELKDISDFLLHETKVDEEEEVEEEGLARPGERKVGREYFTAFFDKRLHYILLSVVVNLLLTFNFGFLFYENIFCPFYTVKIMELLSRREGKSDFQPVLYLFVAGLPKNVQKLTKIILIVISTLLSDLFLYIFSFIIGTKIINIPV